MEGEHFMPPAPLQTAVLFVVFNRPNTTAQVFEAIRRASPPRLYVAADGPRPSKIGEEANVELVRTIATSVDWPCELKTLFRPLNLGCKHAVSRAITWFFEHEEQGIILEDDCLPSQSFFWFCEQLLNLYKVEERIFLVSGFNKRGRWKPDLHDYFFSHLGGIWGWATWRRAWNHFNLEMTGLEEMSQGLFFEKLLGKALGVRRKRAMLHAKKSNERGTMSTWAYPWGFARHKHSAIACVPSINLVSNIGFGNGATHTTDAPIQHLPGNEIPLPLKPNFNLSADQDYDLLFLQPQPPPWIERVKYFFSKK
jgi:hypothetical protein